MDDPVIADPFNRPSGLSKPRGRLLALLCGALQATAIGLGCWMSSLSTAVAPESAALISHDERLWHALGSDELADVLLAVRARQANEKLAAAEQARLQAQQLRLEAEAQAKNLTQQAADRARRTDIEAMRRSDLIHLDTTFIGAEQVLYAEAGEEITLKFAARIQCKEGSFGETAVAAPVDSRIAPREVRNLAACYPSAQTAAGQPIGEVGEWGIAFFKLE